MLWSKVLITSFACLILASCAHETKLGQSVQSKPFVTFSDYYARDAILSGECWNGTNDQTIRCKTTHSLVKKIGVRPGSTMHYLERAFMHLFEKSSGGWQNSEECKLAMTNNFDNWAKTIIERSSFKAAKDVTLNEEMFERAFSTLKKFCDHPTKDNYRVWLYSSAELTERLCIIEDTIRTFDLTFDTESNSFLSEDVCKDQKCKSIFYTFRINDENSVTEIYANKGYKPFEDGKRANWELARYYSTASPSPKNRCSIYISQ